MAFASFAWKTRNDDTDNDNDNDNNNNNNNSNNNDNNNNNNNQGLHTIEGETVLVQPQPQPLSPPLPSPSQSRPQPQPQQEDNSYYNFKEYQGDWNQAHVETCFKLGRLFATPFEVQQFLGEQTTLLDRPYRHQHKNHVAGGVGGGGVICLANNYQDSSSSSASLVEAACRIAMQWKAGAAAAAPFKAPPNDSTSIDTTTATSIATTPATGRITRLTRIVTSQIASAVSRTFWDLIDGNDDDGNDETLPQGGWHQEDDDTLQYSHDRTNYNYLGKEEDDANGNNNANGTRTVVDWNTPVVCASACIACCHQALRQGNPRPPVALYMTASSSSINYDCDNANGECCSFITWCHRAGQLSDNDSDHTRMAKETLRRVTTLDCSSASQEQNILLLAHILCHAGHAVWADETETKPNARTTSRVLVILEESSLLFSTTTQNTNVQDPIKNAVDVVDTVLQLQIQVQRTKLELRSSRHSLERQVQQWTKQADQAGVRAVDLRTKTKKPTSLSTSLSPQVLHHLSRRRLYHNKIKLAQDQILTLEQALSNIEAAETQPQVLTSLQTTSSALKNMRHATPMEYVDNVMEEYQAEMEELQKREDVFQTAIHDNIANVKGTDDDDLLMAELEQLVLGDSPSADTHKNNAMPLAVQGVVHVPSKSDEPIRSIGTSSTVSSICHTSVNIAEHSVKGSCDRPEVLPQSRKVALPS